MLEDLLSFAHIVNSFYVTTIKLCLKMLSHKTKDLIWTYLVYMALKYIFPH